MRLTNLLLATALASATLLGQVPKPRVWPVTSSGPIILAFEPNAAPATVASFRAYVEEDFDAETSFHQAIPEFKSQGGGYAEGMRGKPSRRPSVTRRGMAIGSAYFLRNLSAEMRSAAAPVAAIPTN